MRTWLLCLILIAAPLTGCVGEDGGSGDEAVTRARAEVTDSTGAIEGTVTDTAVQPLEGANVTIPELDRTATTLSDGSFAISDLEPGTYTLVARAQGHISTQQPVQVTAGSVSNVDFLLTKLASKQPFTQEFELNGFMEYGWGLGWNVSTLPDPGAPVDPRLFWVRDSNCDYDAIAGPNCRGSFDLEPPLDSLVFEMGWTPAMPVGENLYAMMRVRDNAAIIDGTWEIFSIEGSSPLYVHLDRADLDAVLADFSARCENGTDQFCGLNFRDQGWPMQTRVWPGWQCPSDQAGFCPELQQEYRQVITGFYHAPAPSGYAILDGNPS